MSCLYLLATIIPGALMFSVAETFYWEIWKLCKKEHPFLFSSYMLNKLEQVVLFFCDMFENFWMEEDLK